MTIQVPSSQTAAARLEKPASSQYPQVDRRERLSLREFRKEYLYPGKPVVITDAIEDWTARTRWNFDYFRSKYTDTSVTVYRLGGERYEVNDAETIALSEFI